MLKKFKAYFSLALLLFISNLSVLQANAEAVSVPSGTRIMLRLPNTITSGSVKTSDSVNLTVAEDVRVDGKVVFVKGSPASLNVEKAQSGGKWGRPGLIALSGGMVTDVEGNKQPINVSYSAKGRSRRAFSITLAIISVPLILVWVGLITLPVAIMASGKDAKVGEGLILDALTTSVSTVDIK